MCHCPSLREDKESIALYLLGEPRGKNTASSPSSEVFRGEHGEWEKHFAITAPSTRHRRLTEFVGTGVISSRSRQLLERTRNFNTAKPHRHRPQRWQSISRNSMKPGWACNDKWIAKLSRRRAREIRGTDALRASATLSHSSELVRRSTKPEISKSDARAWAIGSECHSGCEQTSRQILRD